MPFVFVAAIVLLVVVFAFSASAKVRDLTGFRNTLQAMRVVPRGAVAPVAWLVMIIEAALVPLLLAPATARHALLAAAVFLLVLTVTTAVVSTTRRGVPCQCFGASRMPVGPWHVARGAALALTACAGAGAAHGAVDAAVVIAGTAAGALGAVIVIRLESIAALFAREPGLH